MQRILAVDTPDPGLHLIAPDGAATPLHPLWLRERCADPACVDARTGQRLYNPSDLPADLAIASAAEPAPGVFRIGFTDGHISRFTQHDLLGHAAASSANDGLPARRPWTSGTAVTRPYSWPEAADDAALLAILGTFLHDGFVILSGIPAAPAAVLGVARRFGFPRETNFGTLFDVRSVPDAQDLAYTALSLDPHTDNPYRAPVPGIQLLHCLANHTTGGLSTLVDGLAVAEALRRHDPAAFEILAGTCIGFRYADSTTEHVAYAPMIETDRAGRFIAIHVSPRLDFAPLLEAARLDAFYRARRKLDAMLQAPEFEIRFRLDQGDLVMFDNARLLHGRTAFDPEEGLRHLQGCYIDHDGPRSRYRVLSRSCA